MDGLSGEERPDRSGHAKGPAGQRTRAGRAGDPSGPCRHRAELRPGRAARSRRAAEHRRPGATCPPGSTPNRRCASWGYGTRLPPRIAPAADVRSALLLVERGEAPAGIVYATDAAASKAVSIAGVFPDSSHDPITYPFARDQGRRYAGRPRIPRLPGHTGGARRSGRGTVSRLSSNGLRPPNTDHFDSKPSHLSADIVDR